jgi:hypothetical protein
LASDIHTLLSVCGQPVFSDLSQGLLGSDPRFLMIGWLPPGCSQRW